MLNGYEPVTFRELIENNVVYKMGVVFVKNHMVYEMNCGYKSNGGLRNRFEFAFNYAR